MLYMLIIFTVVVVCYIGVTGAASASGHGRDWDDRPRRAQRDGEQTERRNRH